MKKKLLLILMILPLLLGLASCSTERHDLLYSVQNGSLTYCVRGKKTQAKQVVVKEGDAVLWSEKVTVDKSVGNLKNSFGLVIEDLNFDGNADVLLADKVSGDCVSYICWLHDATNATYQKSEALTGLYNVKADTERKAVLAFSQSILREDGTTTTTDSATQYVWKDGGLVPNMRVSLTYYSENNVYCSSVSYYNPTSGEFEIDNEQEHWYFSEAERNAHDFSALYYFK